MKFTALELCAGGGGQALGLEMAGFSHAATVEYEAQFCETLRANRPNWDLLNKDIRELKPSDYTGLDLLAGGVPCPPFSIAGKQSGSVSKIASVSSVLVRIHSVAKAWQSR